MTTSPIKITTATTTTKTKTTTTTTITDINNNKEISFWQIVKNKLLFSKILAYIDSSCNCGSKTINYKYEEIISCEWLLKNKLIGLLFDKVKTGQHLTFDFYIKSGTTNDYQDDRYTYSIFKSFNQDNQETRSFYKNLYKFYPNYFTNPLIISNTINQIIIYDCLIAFKMIIKPEEEEEEDNKEKEKEYNYFNPTESTLKQSIEYSAISISEFIFEKYNFQIDSNIIWEPTSKTITYGNVYSINRKIDFLVNTMKMKSPEIINDGNCGNGNGNGNGNGTSNDQISTTKYFQHIFNVCIFQQPLKVLLGSCYTILLLQDGILKSFINTLTNDNSFSHSIIGLTLYHQDLLHKFVKQGTLKINNQTKQQLDEISKSFTSEELEQIVDSLELNIKHSEIRNNVRKLFEMVLPFTSTKNDIIFQNYFYYRYKFDDKPELESFYQTFKDYYIEFYDIVKKTLEPFYQSFSNNHIDNQTCLVNAIIHYLVVHKDQVSSTGLINNNNIVTTNSICNDLLRLVIWCDNLDLVQLVYSKVREIALDPFKSELFQIIKSTRVFDYLYNLPYPKSQFKLHLIFNNVLIFKHFINNYQIDFKLLLNGNNSGSNNGNNGNGNKVGKISNNQIQENQYYSFELYSYLYENPQLFSIITDNIQDIWSIIKHSHIVETRFYFNQEWRKQQCGRICWNEFQFFVESTPESQPYNCFEIFEHNSDYEKLAAIDWVFKYRMQDIESSRCRLNERELFYYNYYYNRESFKQLLYENSKSQGRGNQGTCCREFQELELVFTEMGKRADLEVLELLMDNYFQCEENTLVREKHLIFDFVFSGAAQSGHLSVFKHLYEKYSFLFILSEFDNPTLNSNGYNISSNNNNNNYNPNPLNRLSIKFISQVYNICIEKGHIELYFYFSNIIESNSGGLSELFQLTLNSSIKKSLNFNNINLLTILNNKNKK